MKSISRNIIKTLFLLTFLTYSPALTADEGAGALVENFQDNLLSVMKEAKTLGPKGRYDRLEKPIDQTFHLALMIRVATKPYWKKATKEQRKQLLTAFRRMSLSTLATLFNGYSGQVFKHIDEKDGPQKTRIVRTKIVNPDESSHDIAYVAKKYQDRWYLVDVIVDNGISELSVRRSEYHRILSESGPEGLIRVLNAKADELIPRE